MKKAILFLSIVGVLQMVVFAFYPSIFDAIQREELQEIFKFYIIYWGAFAITNFLLALGCCILAMIPVDRDCISPQDWREDSAAHYVDLKALAHKVHMKFGAK